MSTCRANGCPMAGTFSTSVGRVPGRESPEPSFYCRYHHGARVIDFGQIVVGIKANWPAISEFLRMESPSQFGVAPCAYLGPDAIRARYLPPQLPSESRGEYLRRMGALLRDAVIAGRRITALEGA